MNSGQPSLRVLHIISSLDGGGAETVLFRLCTSSPDRAGDTVVSLTTDGVYAKPLRAAGLTVHALAMPRRTPSLAGLVKLYRIFRATRPDIVQTWLYHGDLIGGLVAKLAGQRRVVWNLHNLSLDSVTTARSTRWVLRACALLSRAAPSRISSCSESAMKLHVHFGY